VVRGRVARSAGDEVPKERNGGLGVGALMLRGKQKRRKKGEGRKDHTHTHTHTYTHTHTLYPCNTLLHRGTGKGIITAIVFGCFSMFKRC